MDMRSSATPDAEHSPSTDADASPRSRLWRRGPDAPALPRLDASEAASVLRRAEPFDGPAGAAETAVSAESAELEVERRATSSDRVIALAESSMIDPRDLVREKRGLVRRRARRTHEPTPALAPAAELSRAGHEPAAEPAKRGFLGRHRSELSVDDHAAPPAHAATADDPFRAAEAAREDAEHARAEAAEAAHAGARAEAQRRTVAEQLASETAERMAEATAERVRVEREARLQAEVAAAASSARATAEASARVHAARAEAAAAAREEANELARKQAQAADAAHLARAQAELATQAALAERESAAREARQQAAAAEAAHAARVEAETAALQATREREAAEVRARAQADAAATALAERVAAEAKAGELAASLEEARSALLASEQARLVAEEARTAAPAKEPKPPKEPKAKKPKEPKVEAQPKKQKPTPEPEPTPPVEAPADAPTPAPEPEPAQPAAEARAGAPAQPQRIAPAGAPDHVEIGTPGSSAALTVLLGAAALAAAGVTVYQAYLDQLTSTPGIVAGVVTLFLVVVVGRTRAQGDRVWLEKGVLHVEEGDTHRRFDLTTPDTIVEMVGAPGQRRWKVLIMRKGMAPFEVNAGLVDPEDFLAAVRPWRPRLTSAG